MKSYKLIICDGNTYEQESITTIESEDINPEDFLERCFQLLENKVPDDNLNINIKEPEGFGCAGGFAELYRHLYENGFNIDETLMKFPW